ncbi:ArsR family transcriptional regulator [Mammaliicoccus sciuri]|uniref:ArsR/SmtB family transcription factor n=1 Tax=Mammaliicoccus sciuri TaxID=1296 RepID=UPI001E5A3379|nr:helix-turn-helix transcriptional regulator [Mammaliicoccus sciuri]MCD8874704.1 ArsR family transcriptional regulator [Mammaliicoccus sciuri]
MKILTDDNYLNNIVYYENRGLLQPILKIGAITYVEKLTSFTNYPQYNDILISLNNDQNLILEEITNNNSWKLLINLVNSYYNKAYEIFSFNEYIENLSDYDFLISIFPYHPSISNEDIIDSLNNEEKKEIIVSYFAEHIYYPSIMNFIYSNNLKSLKSKILKYISFTFSIFPNYKNEYTSIKFDISNIEDEKIKKYIKKYEYTNKNIIIIEQEAYHPWTVESQDFENIYIFVAKDTNNEIIEDSLIQAVKCLSDPTKLKIIKKIQQGENTLKSLTNKMKNGKSTIHHHINLLKENKIVYQKDNVYHIDVKYIRQVLKRIEVYLIDD